MLNGKLVNITILSGKYSKSSSYDKSGFSDGLQRMEVAGVIGLTT
jgi:hypothetical protein